MREDGKPFAVVDGRMGKLTDCDTCRACPLIPGSTEGVAKTTAMSYGFFVVVLVMCVLSTRTGSAGYTSAEPPGLLSALGQTAVAY